jgi:hypothetical protein
MILAIVVMLVSTAVYSSYVLAQATVASMGADVARAWLQATDETPRLACRAVLFYVAGAIHLVALSLGSLAQPLLVTELIFIPPIAGGQQDPGFQARLAVDPGGIGVVGGVLGRGAAHRR